MANIKSQAKRNGTNELTHRRNKAVRSALRTGIRKFRGAVAAGETDRARQLFQSTSRDLDKAASKGVIHRNQAANKKSAMAKEAQKLDA